MDEVLPVKKGSPFSRFLNEEPVAQQVNTCITDPNRALYAIWRAIYFRVGRQVVTPSMALNDLPFL